MSFIARHSLTGIWLLLVVATLTSGFLGIETRMGTLLSALALMAITAAKALAVMAEFMELRNAPAVWKLLPGIWLAVVIAILLGGYALGLASGN